MDNNLNTSPTVSGQTSFGPYLNDLFQVIGQPLGGVNAFSAFNNVIGVNTFEDSLNPMDGKTSLREAINQANASPGVDYIVLKSGGTYNIRISGSDENANKTGDFDIFANGSVNILAANGAIINANGLDRVFDVQSGAALYLKNLTVTGGQADGGGAIFNTGTVIIDRSTFSNNSAGAAGGAIFNNGGTATIDRSTFSNNSAVNGGAIFNNQAPSTITVDRSIFSNNSAGSSGGAIFNVGGATTIDRSTFERNSTAGNGGAVYNLFGNATIKRSSFSRNSANDGGAIYNLNFNPNFTTTIESNTFDRNSAANNGGAIHHFGSTLMTVTDSTIRGNSATNQGGGIFIDFGGTVTLNGSKVLANTASAGGGIFIQLGNLILNNSQVKDNRPDNIFRV
jgi:hypothetical protein